MRGSPDSKTENHSLLSRGLACTKPVTQIESVVGCRRNVRCWPMAVATLAGRGGSAYWGAPAAYTRAREVVGAAESDPKPKWSAICSRSVGRRPRRLLAAWLDAPGGLDTQSLCKLNVLRHTRQFKS